MRETEIPSDPDRWYSQIRYLPLPAAGILWYPELSLQGCSWALRFGYRKGSKDFKAVLCSEFLYAA